MVKFRPTRKVKTEPVEERELGDVEKSLAELDKKLAKFEVQLEAKAKAKHLKSDWTLAFDESKLGGGGSLIPNSTTNTLYKYWLSAAATTTPLFTTTTTAAGSSFVPFKRTSTTATSMSVAWEDEPRISHSDMVALVDGLVKERYPAYEPNR